MKALLGTHSIWVIEYLHNHQRSIVDYSNTLTNLVLIMIVYDFS